MTPGGSQPFWGWPQNTDRGKSSFFIMKPHYYAILKDRVRNWKYAHCKGWLGTAALWRLGSTCSKGTLWLGRFLEGQVNEFIVGLKNSMVNTFLLRNLLSLITSEWEAIPFNNLMMRRAGFTSIRFEASWFTKSTFGHEIELCTLHGFSPYMISTLHHSLIPNQFSGMTPSLIVK